MRVVLAGGSGALGGALGTALTTAGHEVVVLSRTPGPGQVGWDGRTAGPWSPLLDGAVVVNLAGKLVDCRPTARTVELLTRSRVEPTRALVAAAARYRPALWVQMSTLAIYGDAGEVVLDESAPPAAGPPQMAGVATAWEEAAAQAPCDRQVLLRTAVVLDRDTPALDRLAAVTRYGLGGRVGSGRQWVSWLHVADLVAIVRRLIDSDLAGVVHATSPEPVRNADLMRALRHALHRPPAPPTPATLVRLGSLLLRTDPALALTGRRAVPRRLLDAGFAFAHPTVDGALADLL